VIEGFAAALPVGLVRALQNHEAVLAISSDAEVTANGLATSVTGTAANSAYTLRSTLGLDSPIRAGTTSFAKAETATLSWSHTVASGDNRLLVVRTAHQDGTKSVTSVDYGGRALTKFLGVNGPSNANHASLWYLVDPLPGTATVVVRFAAREVIGSATSFSGVHQSAPFGTFSASNGTTTAAAVTLASSSGEVVVDAIAARGDALSLTPSGSRTVQVNAATGSANDEVRSAGSFAPGTNSVTMSWTLGVGRPWALIAASLRQAPTTALTGAGVTVAVIDSGLLQDGGGTSRIKTTRDFTGGSTNPNAISPVDGYGHGTHVAGLAGGEKAEAKGVAPGVAYVSLRVLNSLGAGSTSHVISALEWAVTKKAVYDIDIINLSLGHPIYEPAATDPLVQAVEAAVRAGLVVVASAGNYGTNPLTGQVGYAGINSPGNAPSAITVGATRTYDTTTRTDDTSAGFTRV
jgi:hypothetical protein